MNAVHGDDGGYVVFGAMIGTHVGDEVSPSGFADERDAVYVNLIDGSVVLDPADCFFNVVSVGRKFMVWGETIVDGEPCEVGVGQWLKQIGNVLALVSSH